MKGRSVIALLFAAVIVAIVPVSPQRTLRGVALNLDQAQAVTYGHYRRVHRRLYRRARYGGGYYHHSCVGYFGPGCCGRPGRCPHRY